jgi:REP element-mobilizing transposase RayT
MPHAFTNNHIHLVFSTKERRKLISSEFQPETWSYMAGICKKTGLIPVAINGMADHVHLLFHLPPALSLAKAVSSLKANSSRWLNEQKKIKFAWQEGYGAFSVSASNVAVVARYIRNQQQHHKNMSYADEFLALLRKHNIEFDRKYALG